MSMLIGAVIGALAVGTVAVVAVKSKESKATTPVTTPQNTKFDLVDTQTGDTLKNQVLSNLDLVSLQSQLPPRYSITNQTPTNSSPTTTINQVFSLITLEQDFVEAENKRTGIDEFVIFSNLV
jgi:hypothetical protein